MSWWSTSTNGGFTVVFTSAPPPPPPRCNECGAPPTRQTPDGKKWCHRCLVAQCAADLFDLLFGAVTPEQRKPLFRALALCFHPDQGGDERTMRVLNATKERYP